MPTLLQVLNETGMLGVPVPGRLQSELGRRVNAATCFYASQCMGKIFKACPNETSKPLAGNRLLTTRCKRGDASLGPCGTANNCAKGLELFDRSARSLHDIKSPAVVGLGCRPMLLRGCRISESAQAG